MKENLTPNGSQNKDNSMPWIAIIVCFIFFWPLGLVLLISKLVQQEKAQRPNQAHRPPQAGARPGAANRPGAQTGPAYRPGPAQRPGPNQRPGPARYETAAPPHGAANTAQSAPHATTARPRGAEKKSAQAAPAGGGRAAFLTTLGVVLSFVGAFFVALAAVLAQNPIELPGAVSLFVIGGFSLGGGVTSFVYGNRWSRRMRQYKRICAVIGKRDVISVYELGRALGRPADEIREQLLDLIDRGFFGESAYFDYELMSFVRSYEAAEALRQKAAEARVDFSSGEADGASRTTNYVAIVNDMHELRYSLTDDAIAQRFDRIIDLTVKIFLVLEEHPEKAEQCRRFTTYYLPTTLKLLRSYGALEARGLDNVNTTKQDIIRVLDNLIDGFQQQHDRLFSGEKLDLRTDIQVLENMLRRDGLTGDEFGQPMPGGGV
ncbi:MAG TPA: hypothetical protein GXZ77_08945 [Papillibacter sp.]|jgi:hypothetical protein|nr:hypothetical protein [Papillibacter sp.]